MGNKSRKWMMSSVCLAEVAVVSVGQQQQVMSGSSTNGGLSQVFQFVLIPVLICVE